MPYTDDTYTQDIVALEGYRDGSGLSAAADTPVILYDITRKINTLIENTNIMIGEGNLLDYMRSITPTVIHVAMNGEDDPELRNGSIGVPLRTLEKALIKAQRLKDEGKPAIAIKLMPGIYFETCPLVVPRDVSILGHDPRTVTVRPTDTTKENDILKVDSGTLIWGITFTGQIGQNAFAVSFNELADNTELGASGLGAYLFKAPLIQNCICLSSNVGSTVAGVMISPILGSPGGAISAGGIEVDGSKCADNSPIRSMIADTVHITSFNGKCILVKEDGYIQLNSISTSFGNAHIECLTGGWASLYNNSTSYGVYGLIAKGYSSSDIYSGQVISAVSEAREIRVGCMCNESPRYGNSSQPYKGMIILIDEDLYTVISVEKIVENDIISGEPVILYDITLDKNLITNSIGKVAHFRRRSQIMSNSHSVDYLGSGTDYKALPENGGVPDRENFVTEENGGKVFYSSLDDNGNFRVGDHFIIDGTTGEVTIGPTTINLPELELNSRFLYRYDKSENRFYFNETRRDDGWTPLPLSINVNDLSNEDFNNLLDRISKGTAYQIYVDIDNANATDEKNNTGTNRLKPFKTIERALLEVARRSIVKGQGNDIYNKVSIYVAPGEYRINNGLGGSTVHPDYNQFQDAANLILLNRNYILNAAMAPIDGDSSLINEIRQELLTVINSISDDLSLQGNYNTLMIARRAINRLAPNSFDPATYFNSFYYEIYSEDLNFSQLIQALEIIRDQSILAMRNLGSVVDNSITVDTESGVPIVDELKCASVATTIANLIELLKNALLVELNSNPHKNISINVGTGANYFPEEGEISPAILQSFNSPLTPGVILPRGVSIIGADLRKVIIKPKYVPNPNDAQVARAAIFRMTGGNFFSGFTVLDQSSIDRNYENAKSHHKLSAFEFCTEADLELYYNSVVVSFADRAIYNRAQDAVNLITKNINWIENYSINTYNPDVRNLSYKVNFSNEISFFLNSLISDLKILGRSNTVNFAHRFKEAHIDEVAPVDKTNVVNVYKYLFNLTVTLVIQAIGNQANEAEGGFVDSYIKIDPSPGIRCADIVSAIHNYKAIIFAVFDEAANVELNSRLFSQADAEPRPLESKIVSVSLNSSNTVEGASPYIFSASVRSEFGMCGIDGDGAKVGGLKSYLAAQFTVISLQTDPNAFTTVDAEKEVTGLRYKGSRATDKYDNIPDYRNFGYRVSNGAYAQLVSCFCICPAIHYWADSGGEFSITNSTSNFGDISLYAEGYNPVAYPQDRNLKFAGILKPKDVDYIRTRDITKASIFNLGVIETITVVPGQPNQLKITLKGLANYYDGKFSIDKDDRKSWVYAAGSITERAAKVVSTSVNNNKTEIIINTSISGATAVDSWLLPENSLLAPAIGRNLYIKRFVDPRKSDEKLYKLILKRVPPTGGTRRPSLNYIIQKQVTGGQEQPFKIPEITPEDSVLAQDNVFYIINIKDSELLITEGNSDERSYEITFGSINNNRYGELEYESDLSINNELDLDWDPRETVLSTALDRPDLDIAYSKNNVIKFLQILGLSGVNLTVNANRVVSLLVSNVNLEICKPTIIRCGSQTWEYMGYYNYSTGLPINQTSRIGEGLDLADSVKKAFVFSKLQSQFYGGQIYATGMDELGSLYQGRNVIDLRSGVSENILQGSSPEVVTSETPPEIPSYFQRLDVDILTIANSITIDDDAEVFGLPEATIDRAGIAQIATDQEVKDEISSDKFITPSSLSKWRIHNKIVSGRVISSNVYVSNRTAGFHSLAGSLRDQDSQHGNAITFEEFNINQNNSENDGKFWQLSNPNAPNFRCLSNLEQLALYGNSNLTTNDSITLFLDPGKYRADFSYDFGIVINGVNNKGFDGWGEPDGSDITADASSGGVILYVTCNAEIQLTTSSIQLNPTSMVFNSQSATSINYVHFWSHVTAIKDLNTQWANKGENENTFEQFLTRVNATTWDQNRNSTSVNIREKYQGSWSGLNRPLPVIRLRGSGAKRFSYCSFSGQGISNDAYDRGGNYNGGYIYILDSCEFQLRNIVLRGNEEIRFSDKHGRFITTAGNIVPALVPPVNFREESNGWTYAPLYDNAGNILTSNIYRDTYRDCFHDPFTQEWVSIGFTDRFIGIGQNATVRIGLQGNTFSNQVSFFGSNEVVGFSSTDRRVNGVITVNNDAHNIRLERNTGKLFGTEDDRVISGASSEDKIGEDLVYFRGTDNLGRKVKELHPPALLFNSNGVINNPAWSNWVNSFKDQGPIINKFIDNRFAYTLTSRFDYDIWSDRDSSGLIRGQGFLGEFGYKPQITNYKLTSIQSSNFSSSTYGTTVNWALNGVGCKYQTGNQFHYNLFRPAWKGFRLGKYQHLAIIDIGTNFTTLTNNLVSNSNDFSILASYIEGVTYLKNINDLPGDAVQLHTLDGEIVGAMFAIVGVNASQLLSVMYTGYEKDVNGNKIHKFIKITKNTGVSEYFTAKTNNYIFDTVAHLFVLNQNLPVNTRVYIKESNLFLNRTNINNFDNGHSSLKSWSPLALNVGYEVLHNLANMGLFGTIYKRGFFIEKLGLECNTETDYSSLSVLPDHPQLRSGLYANTKFSGLEIFITGDENVVL